MFSKKEKQFIAAEVEKLLLSLNHPEMPKEKAVFHVHVEGKEDWSWADIEPNWVFDDEICPEIKIKRREGMPIFGREE